MKNHKLVLAFVFGLSFLLLSMACSSSGKDTTAVDSDSIKESPSSSLPDKTATPTRIPIPTKYVEQRTWSQVALFEESAWDLEIDPSNSETLYVAYQGLQKSIDGGATWSQISTWQILDIAIDPSNSSIIYAGGTSDSFLKSIDGGKTKTPLTIIKWVTITAIAIDPNSSDTIYVGTENDGVYKSLDGGEEWVEINNGLITEEVNKDYFRVHTLKLDPQDSNIIFAGTSYGVFKSIDGGVNWISKTNGLMIEVYNSSDLYYSDIYDMVIDPSNSKTIYATSETEAAYKSEDGGENWYPITQYLRDYLVEKDTGMYRGAPSIVIDPSSAKTVYICTYGGGVLVTRDGGVTWSDLNQGLASTYVKDLRLDPSDPTRLYALVDYLTGTGINDMGTVTGGILVFQE